MESELLHKMKIINGELNKVLKRRTGDHYMDAGGFRYYTQGSEISGNTCEVMILVGVGNEFPVGKVVHPRIRNPALAERAKQMYGTLPSIVPGLHEEAAADLMATASFQLKIASVNVVKLYLDVPMMQRSKQYYLDKIQEFLQHCKERVGMYAYTHIHYVYMMTIKYQCRLKSACTPHLYLHSYDYILRQQ